MLFSESGSNQLAQYSGLSKLLASELGHPYGLNHEIPPLGEAQISYSLYDAAVTPCQADRLIANYADHVKPIAIMLRWQGLGIGEALRADWLHLNRRAHLRCTKRPARRLHQLWVQRGSPQEGTIFLTHRGVPYRDPRDYKVPSGSPIKKAHATA